MLWFVAHDGGATWEQSKPVRSAFAPGGDDHARRAVRRTEDSLLAVCPYGGENFPDTKEKRQELSSRLGLRSGVLALGRRGGRMTAWRMEFP